MCGYRDLQKDGVMVTGESLSHTLIFPKLSLAPVRPEQPPVDWGGEPSGMPRPAQWSGTTQAMNMYETAYMGHAGEAVYLARVILVKITAKNNLCMLRKS